MMMEFLFLGTGPAEAIPRAGHEDALCRDARKPDSKSRRLRSAGLLMKGETRVLFDAGPDIGYQLASRRADRLDAVFITHAHGDAASGLKDLDAWAEERGATIPVYTERPTERRYGPFGSLKYRFKRPGERAAFDAINASFFRVSHSAKPGYPTLGFRIGAFAYASDVAELPKDALEALEGVRTLVLDGAFWFGRGHRSHLTADRAMRYAVQLGVRHLVLTQIGHTYPPHEEAQLGAWKFADEHAPGLKVTLAFDGLRLKL